MIGVIGSDKVNSEEILQIAEKIGEDIAKNNCVLVCGGRGGVMEAACRGAKKFNGLTVGILPSLDKKEANAYVDIPITTDLGNTRNSLVVSSSDAVIAVAGNVGTLSEIGLSLCNNKPLILVKGSGGVSDYLADGKENLEFRERLNIADKEEAVTLALQLI